MCTSSFYTGSPFPLTDDPGYSPWKAWDTCSETCGSSGTKTRTRACDNPSPKTGDVTCSGDSSETQSCNQIPCGNFLLLLLSYRNLVEL